MSLISNNQSTGNIGLYISEHRKYWALNPIFSVDLERTTERNTNRVGKPVGGGWKECWGGGGGVRESECVCVCGGGGVRGVTL